MDPDFLNMFAQPPALTEFIAEDVLAQGEKRKLIKPASSSNPKLEELKLNTSRGLKTANAVEYISGNKENLEAQSKDDAFDELFSRAPNKLDAVKKVLLQFVNQHVGKLGLNVKDMESQFADGVILLLLIGQLEGYFLNLRDFFLTPAGATEMGVQFFGDAFYIQFNIIGRNSEEHSIKAKEMDFHNVNLALDLLADGHLMNFSVNSEDIVHGDTKTIMRILYSLYAKYKTKGT